MDQVLNLLLHFFTLALSLTISLLLHHAVATSSAYSSTILHITPSLHQAQEVLSFNPIPTLQQKAQFNRVQTTSSSFSLSLHPRDSIFNPQHNDYQTLVRSRLHRDSARLNVIINNFNRQLNKSALDSRCRSKNFSAPITSGLNQNMGEYFTRIGVGQPAKQFYMCLDTGSDVSWIQCHPCIHCYKQSDPIFDPTKSSSYRPLTCKAQQCKEQETISCNNNTCQYYVMYGDGSLTAGDFITETVSFGSTGSMNRVAIGCGHFNTGLFIGSAGILALGSGKLSFNYQIKAKSFSYCLVNRDSHKSSTLEFNSPRPADSLTTQLLNNPKQKIFYYVGFTAINVGGQNVAIPRSTFEFDKEGMGGMIIDSGTTVTRLQTQAYKLMRDMFVSFTQDFKRAHGPPLFDTCFDFSGLSDVVVPTVSFQVSDGRLWTLPAENYLISVDKNGTYCFAFAPSFFPLSILGNIQQQGTRISFDLENSIVGFSPQKC
ncbi:hypothetical protein RIF29_00757 [Crotalaria pallida]|uniref:Peptidase A1 domain-containing protein n=1 Tax=Crotalaria pallida TaxID=3830 RepID=A0AAN9P788_CROPI